MFSLTLTTPQNFSSYRQIELDNTRISAFQGIEPLPYISKRFALKRYLGWTEEEIMENEKMWREEREDPELNQATGKDLRQVGVSPGGIESDLETGEEIGAGEETMGDLGMGESPPVGGETPGAGAAPASTGVPV
jgi:hypothetical protein